MNDKFQKLESFISGSTIISANQRAHANPLDQQYSHGNLQDVDFVNTLPESIKHKDARNQDPAEGFKNLGRLDKKTKIMCPKKSSA